MTSFARELAGFIEKGEIVMMQSTPNGQNIGPVLVSCARSVALWLFAMALLVGFVLALPSIGEGVAFVWYGWARILTSNYATVIPAALLEWGALIVAAWTACVAVKLNRAKSGGGLFVAAVVLLLVFAVLPANCAVVAVSSDWRMPLSAAHTPIERAAYATAALVIGACIFAPVLAFLVCLTREGS
ncbi:MAG: hypothetical protein IOC33_00295 [Burkholderia sp.]|uniref:hypothetical protein n=2 Tax=Burkholderia sp. TaxID=36773 RepID=UPI002589433E|nr:hypothetical protein [Burkholderia sp.]MCA3644460.1 hypothetical protein [Methylobacterium sp.]MCA3793050.1 hypothetical protein [Burkholderia sp.]MCA3804262.1 hypothetical protein [Burkholderia sp.]MCA3806703.1 hypothetical protein [Burkholderia sp.]MCA3840132.1 hypothetical protein [Burkholderia sp.]